MTYTPTLDMAKELAIMEMLPDSVEIRRLWIILFEFMVQIL